MLALPRQDIKRLVPMNDAIELMKLAFGALSAGRTESPLRTVITVDESHGDALFMPAFVPDQSALGIKVVSVFGENSGRGLPVIHALVVLLDPSTGQPVALMDGTYLTALRTGAVAGAATDLLARPDSRVLTVIGPGAQGVTQIAAVCAVRPIERVIVVGREGTNFTPFLGRLENDWPDLVGRVETTTDAALAVSSADVVSCATNSRTPVFEDAAVQPGTHINAVGAYTPEMQEIPEATVKRARIVVDAVEAALAEAGDLLQPLAAGLIDRERLSVELGMLVNGSAEGRTTADEITFFKSVGNAVQDVVVAKHAVDRARDLGIGTELTLD